MLNKLINYSKIERFAQFGIKTEDFQTIEEMVRKLYVLGEMLLVESTEAKFNIRNLLVWLNKGKFYVTQPPSNPRRRTKQKSKTPNRS